jgi:hypothetical protein
VSVLAYGEEFQGMSTDQILVEVAVRLKAIETKVDNIRCPSPRCQDHETRLNTIETTAANRKEAGLSIQAWISIAAAVMVSFIGFGLEIYLAVKG